MRQIRLQTLTEPIVRRALKVPRRIPGYLKSVRRLRSRSVSILMYHGVTPVPLPVFNWCQLGLERFTEQLAFIAAEYNVLPLREVVDRMEAGAPLPARTAVLTFDDAFRNVLTTAYPVLEKYQTPATVFVVTSLPDSRQPAWPEQVYHALVSTQAESATYEGTTWLLRSADERSAAYRAIAARLKRLDTGEREVQMGQLLAQIGAPPPVAADAQLATMAWDEIAALAAGALVEFGSHTHTHPILSRCSVSRQAEELRISRDILRERLGRADLFAYPNGTAADFTDDTRHLLQQLEYRCGLSTIPGLNVGRADRFALRRVNVGADTAFPEFEMIMTGL
jgi:peptidoglycan/xylan/chitin deacetylase (PgdA/CDA1 family)